MAGTTVFIFVLVLLLPSPPATTVAAVPLRQWRTLFSLSQSLMRRVSTARAARGDFTGAARARSIAEKLDGGWSFWSGVWSMGFDYIRHYSWRDLLSDWPPQEVFGAMADLSGLLAAVNELGRVGSGEERVKWVAENYKRVFSSVASLLKRLLLAFSRSGPLREAVLALRQEVEEGGLVRDVLEVGSEDLTGLVLVAKDLAFQYLFNGSTRQADEL